MGAGPSAGFPAAPSVAPGPRASGQGRGRTAHPAWALRSAHHPLQGLGGAAGTIFLLEQKGAKPRAPWGAGV